MSYVSSLLEILRGTLKRLETQPEFAAADAHARELRRYLLIAIADLEERIDDEASESSPSIDQVSLPALASSSPTPSESEMPSSPILHGPWANGSDEAPVYLVRYSPRS